ncbi:hypothetical protein TCDM_05563 [Trypanosoma cruzi Dm28c]|uniref:Uncharacterized protein n=1 Tax=Trypanosoma cruzi Dm28c TaxID=1416333 RepID=V5BDY5_TRYCR|nr:hypothetical protein TCDM_05563 [Trypanosoma cruzi Dm28c]
MRVPNSLEPTCLMRSCCRVFWRPPPVLVACYDTGCNVTIARFDSEMDTQLGVLRVGARWGGEDAVGPACFLFCLNGFFCVLREYFCFFSCLFVRKIFKC